MSVIRHIIVRGRVQGVGFRAFVEHEALKRGMSGWVRNRRDGTVEAVFAGDEAKVAAAIEACRRGPDGRARRSARISATATTTISSCGGPANCSRCCRRLDPRRPEQRFEFAPQHHVDFRHATPECRDRPGW